MGLRRQLLLVALMTLALPWAGCQYVKEMEKTLRVGQLAALEATAQAIAARFSSDPALMASLTDPVQPFSYTDFDRVFYAHPLEGAISVDGYGGDWDQLGFFDDTEVVASSYASDSVRVFSAQGEGSVYFLIQVSDSHRQFYNPSEGLERADHVKLVLNDGGLAYDGAPRFFRVFSAASGAVVVEESDANSQWSRVHQLSGFWNEKGSSYVIELKVPMSWIKSGLGVKPNDGANPAAGQQDANPNFSPVVLPKQKYQSDLGVFTRKGVKLHLTLPNGWLLASTGGYQTFIQPKGFDAWFRKLIRKIVGEGGFEERVETPLNGRLFGDELLVAQKIGRANKWYRSQSKTLARSVVSIPLSNGLSINVVAEESTDSVVMLTTGAVGRLLLYCFVATIAVTVVLLLYSTLLSFRIRRLSTSIHNAVDNDGRVRGVFRASQSHDEVGELSRIYEAMLLRQSSYASYLESLSSKLSHELKTPLAIVSSSLDNLVHFSLSEQQKVYVDRASGGVQRLSTILSSMSAAARVEQAIQGASTEPVNIVELLDQMVSAYQDTYTNRTIYFDCDEVSSAYLDAAPELLVQMLDKLMENAADFSGSGGQVWFTLVVEDRRVIIRVANNGPRLPEGFESQIFDSLVSVRVGLSSDSDLSRGANQSQHLGLGLHIAMLIARFHKGDLSAYNHSGGEKVVFEVSLPRIRR